MTYASKIKIDGRRKGFLFLMNIRKDPLNFFVNLMQEEGDYVWYQIMGEKVLLLNDASGIEAVLKNKFEYFKKGKFYKVLKPLLGEGIFLTEKKQWKKQRLESLPVFSGKNYEEMTEQIIKACDSWTKRLKVKSSLNQRIDINKESMWYTLDVVLRTLCHEDREDVSESMNKSMQIILHEAEQRIWGAFLLPQNIQLRFPKYKNALEFINSLVESLIEDRKKIRKHPDDLLSTLIRSYDASPKNQRELQDQIINFLLAGHETTANALSWFFYEISVRPEIKNKIIEEIEQTIGDNEINYKNIMDLRYTKAVFQETLRLYPPVWTMSRTALKDVKINLDNGEEVIIPKDTSVMLCSYAVHRRSKYWNNPCAFDPERFLRKNDRPFFSYFPFSAGPRLCIGHKFALIESLVAIVMLMKQFNFKLLPGQNIKPDPIITLRPNKPIYFNIDPNNNDSCSQSY